MSLCRVAMCTMSCVTVSYGSMSLRRVAVCCVALVLCRVTVSCGSMSLCRMAVCHCLMWQYVIWQCALCHVADWQYVTVSCVRKAVCHYDMCSCGSMSLCHVAMWQYSGF